MIACLALSLFNAVQIKIILVYICLNKPGPL